MDFRELFHRASAAAEGLERCKAQIEAMRANVSSPHGARFDAIATGGGATDPSGAIDAMIDSERRLRERAAREYGATIDAAWDAVKIIAADLSDESAQVLSQHYLFGMTWPEVAQSIARKSTTTPKTLANVAMDWLDSWCEVVEEQDGPHVRMLKR